jgi:aminoglycoside phosphotransferase (APT) family kinase protein
MSDNANLSKTNAKFELQPLQDYLEDRIGRFKSPLSVRIFADGASNPTYLLSTDGDRWVMRSKPIGKLAPGAHAIHREFRILTALQNVDFPAPKPILYCDDPSVIGADFYLMEFIEGRIFHDYNLPGLSASERSQIYDSMNQLIARLHSLDYREMGLEDYGKGAGFFSRQVALWERQYYAHTLRVEGFERLAEWIKANIPEERTSITHGDFSLLNLLCHPIEPRIVGVLDWELSTIGHPLADFAYNLIHWYSPTTRAHLGYYTLDGNDLAGTGIPSMEKYISMYCERTGNDISAREINFAIAFNLFRGIGISVGNLARVEDGTAKNELSESCRGMVLPSLERAWHFVEKADRLRS